jgi:hypothetical protein
MSALGQKRTSDCRPLMSAIHPKAEIASWPLDVRFVPKAEIPVTSQRQLICAPFREFGEFGAVGCSDRRWPHLGTV